jgi:hypothetical protein
MKKFEMKEFEWISKMKGNSERIWNERNLEWKNLKWKNFEKNEKIRKNWKILFKKFKMKGKKILERILKWKIL